MRAWTPHTTDPTVLCSARDGGAGGECGILNKSKCCDSFTQAEVKDALTENIL